jgi:hypothetical protein
MTVTLRSDNFDAFFDAPFVAYGPDSVYVSPMKSDLKRFLAPSNPLFIKDSQLAFFTAHKDGRVVGRITAHIHAESNQLHGESRGYFGYFDCVYDKEVAQSLLGAADGWLRDRQIAEIAGNFNLTAMQQIGVMTRGFEHAPHTDQVWSPPHIARLLTELGYEAVFPMVTAEVDLPTTPVPPLGPKQLAILDDPDFAFVPISRRTVPARMEDARLVLNASFAENPMFVPVSKEEFHFQAKDMRWIMDPRISSVIYHKDAPAGCVICVPDLNPFVKKDPRTDGYYCPVSVPETSFWQPTRCADFCRGDAAFTWPWDQSVDVAPRVFGNEKNGLRNGWKYMDRGRERRVFGAKGKGRCACNAQAASVPKGAVILCKLRIFGPELRNLCILHIFAELALYTDQN